MLFCLKKVMLGVKYFIGLNLAFSLFVLSAQNRQIPMDQVAYFCRPCSADCDHIAFDEPGSCPHCGMALEKKSYGQQIRDINNRMKIAFYLQDGVEVLDFAGPMEVFAYAGYDVFTVSKTKDPMITQGVLTFIPDYSIANAPAADVVAFFGGNSGLPVRDKEVIQWVKNQKESADYFLSVCTGAFILAEAGILDGKTATTFHSALDNLENNYKQVKVLRDVRFVDNGNVITTAGISAGIDGALHLVAKLNGLKAAEAVAFYMEYDKWVPGEGLILDPSTKEIYSATAPE